MAEHMEGETMPMPVDNLTPESSPVAIREAISKSMEMCMNEPQPPDVNITDKRKWCAGKAYGIARQNTGKELK